MLFRSKREIELTKEQEQHYSTMKATAMALLKGDVVRAPHVLTQLMRLHQITCGHLTTESGEIIDIPNKRLNELMEVLDEVEGKAIIWAHYVHDVEKITKELSKVYGPESVISYYGKTLSEQRQKNIEAFQDPRSAVRFFVGNPQTGGYGITLTEANTVIYYSNGYDLEKRLQSEDRAHRIGQKKSEIGRAHV